MNRVKKVIDFLNEHVHERLSLDDMAHHVCLSPIQLYRVFKQDTGFTPTQYHEQLKIKESLSLLQNSKSISDVAFDLGYKNYETFSRAFKRLSSVSPSDLLWGMSFIKKQPQDCNYALVKADASLAQLKQLVNEHQNIISDTSDTLIYRMHPKSKGRPRIVRCKRSEELVRPFLV